MLPGEASGPPLAVLVWHHGIAEHIGRYREVFTRLAEAGVAVYAGDVVGHGRSEGARALILSYREAVSACTGLPSLLVCSRAGDWR